ncbi:glycine cleavage system protein GcvH [Pontimonas sp.]|jgi:glycine cleavage system H protein|uniref:glycine cleavage system protein GcvH n=1 Tax=Pontimonas sp. TaxID=2304492 RepID=UPI00287044F6|nr:glycine cleavage system protein GcvH [Pontimonas sp.]MDR9396210.1 glycine cleavage system protein GcvH [Pontimonas sp.]MDR9435119.1 glycine cleavage system protein GcvH [Pontimonas sp.]
MSDVPSHLRYTSDHEWVLADGDSLKIGITRYAADALGDVVYVDHPAVGSSVQAGAIVGEVESTKSVGEIFSPVTGTVVETNQAVVDDPELINRDPYGEGWLFRVDTTDSPDLMDADAYTALIGQ